MHLLMWISLITASDSKKDLLSYSANAYLLGCGLINMLKAEF